VGKGDVTFPLLKASSRTGAGWKWERKPIISLFGGGEDAVVCRHFGRRYEYLPKPNPAELRRVALQEFHRVHSIPLDQAVRDLNEALAWLPKSAYATEAKPLAAWAGKKPRDPQRIGELLIPLHGIKFAVASASADSLPAFKAPRCRFRRAGKPDLLGTLPVGLMPSLKQQ
jgi:hypothetical protein